MHSEHGVVRIGSRLQRRLLAVLLVHARTVVSADRLVDILWGSQPPANARQSLWTCVARLRRTLADQEGTPRDELLVTRPPGYLLAAEPEQIDAGLFEHLVGAATRVAADEPRAAADLLDRALALWRGPALQEFADEPFAAAEAARLDELRLTATEDRFEIDLILGAHATLIGKLSGFAAEHPLRDRPRAQLMLALYRCGRQVEALEAFRHYRELLDREARARTVCRPAFAADADPAAGRRARLAFPARREMPRARWGGRCWISSSSGGDELRRSAAMTSRRPSRPSPRRDS